MSHQNFLLRPFSLESLETLELRPDQKALPKVPQRFDALLSLDTRPNWSVETLLSHTRELLKFDGALLLLVENPFSLNHWNGKEKEGRTPSSALDLHARGPDRYGHHQSGAGCFHCLPGDPRHRMAGRHILGGAVWRHDLGNILW